MDNTYYLIRKQYKGLFIKKHVGNNSIIVTTVSKTNEGLIFVPIGIYKGTNKPVFWSAGFYPENADEIVSELQKDKNVMVLEKIPSTAVEIINNKIDYVSIDKWESPLKINISLKKPGQYLRSKTIKMLLIEQLQNNSIVLLADMIFKQELKDIAPEEIKMAAYKAGAMFKSMSNLSIAKTQDFDIEED